MLRSSDRWIASSGRPISCSALAAKRHRGKNGADRKVRPFSEYPTLVLVAVAHVGGPAISFPLNQCVHDYRPGDRRGWSGEQGRQALLDPCECTSVGLFKLSVYEFPKDKLVYGPFQIEARIKPEHRYFAADLAVEPDGLACHSWQSFGRADRELASVCVAALSSRGVRPVAGTQASDRGVRRPCGDGGEPSGCPGCAVQGIGPGCLPASQCSTSGPADERARDALGHNDRAIGCGRDSAALLHASW
jgi:hypothetical protein